MITNVNRYLKSQGNLGSTICLGSKILNQGPQGDRGPQGDTGPTGPNGPTGQRGPRGPAGPRGPRGPQGFKGPPGPPGQPGDDGDKGDPGPIGEIGDTGHTGNTGPDGWTGWTGPVGDEGPQGGRLINAVVRPECPITWGISNNGLPTGMHVNQNFEDQLWSYYDETNIINKLTIPGTLDTTLKLYMLDFNIVIGPNDILNTSSYYTIFNQFTLRCEIQLQNSTISTYMMSAPWNPYYTYNNGINGIYNQFGEINMDTFTHVLPIAPSIYDQTIIFSGQLVTTMYHANEYNNANKYVNTNNQITNLFNWKYISGYFNIIEIYE